MLVQSDILSEAEAFAREILSKDLPRHLTYHSAGHTEFVVNSALEIGKKQKLSADDMEVIHLAAWFHDLGYTEGWENHEERGAAMARKFLEAHDYDPQKLDKVIGCIMATRMPQDPQTDLEQVLCDADMMHLASTDYFKKADMMHKEIEEVKSCKISEMEWLKMNKDFLKKHCFFTDYARDRYESGVKENLRKVRQRLKSWTTKTNK